MLYLCALLCPPLACLCAGKFLHACLNFVMMLTMVLIPVAMVHAWMVVKGSYQPLGAGTSVYIDQSDWSNGKVSPRREMRRSRR